VPSSGVRVVSSDMMGEFVKTGRVSNQIFYGVLKENWETLPKEKRSEFVQKLLAQGGQLGYTQVSLVNKDGKHAAYASKDKLEVLMP